MGHFKATFAELQLILPYSGQMSHPLYVDAAPCTNNATNTSSSTLAPYSYVYVGWLNSSELRPSCQIEHMSFIASKGLIHGDEKLSYEDVHNQLVYGFELSWLRGRETPDRPLCFLDPSNQVRCGARKICTYFAVIGFMPMICAQQSNIQRITYRTLFFLSHFELLIKIIDPKFAPEDRSSEMYFPDWVYDQVSKENDTELEISMEEERKLEKKMIIVALWCIQMRPSYRPSMSKVIEMLEGEIESLELPPKPFLCPQGIETEDFRETTNSAYSSGLSGDSLESNQLLSNSNKGD
ncbi:hypothetical protein FEM48_Zijuj05G0088400 [Ziziphus jujuba var. spinosa]|uniref:Uncharacterized protein n=1 Tax=Ziziphus jujuba var. spinosa TaxID=714518 RepID=A0A978VE04_ZIZJJ|nr:hypothetical protein FEM48_Zijuj05G0088400 [Ziziphus jujuba var. spinosa]